MSGAETICEAIRFRPLPCEVEHSNFECVPLFHHTTAGKVSTMRAERRERCSGFASAKRRLGTFDPKTFCVPNCLVLVVLIFHGSRVRSPRRLRRPSLGKPYAWFHSLAHGRIHSNGRRF